MHPNGVVLPAKRFGNGRQIGVLTSVHLFGAWADVFGACPYLFGARPVGLRTFAAQVEDGGLPPATGLAFREGLHVDEVDGGRHGFIFRSEFASEGTLD